jgi:putative membrane-bound dehydrogenase-like protein
MELPAVVNFLLPTNFRKKLKNFHIKPSRVWGNAFAKKFFALSLLLCAFAILCFELGCGKKHDPSLQSFQIHPDFQIELAAKEPVVFDPVDLEFDEHGRAFVIEMPGYPFMKEKSRVILLDDQNGDGEYDYRTVFAEELNFADAILPYRGGLLVAAPPHLLSVKDTTGDGVADTREILLDGFAVENPQHNINGLTHGLDNWIYGANGGNSGNVFWPGDSLNRIPLRDDDFRFNLDLKKFERIGESAGGFGIAMDDWGRIFGTHNLEHISLLVIPGRYFAGISAPESGTRAVISDHEENGLARIFPIGPQETRVNHPEQSGYFSGACGVTCYTGGAFPEAFNGNVFVADVVLNLVHQDVIKPNGASLTATRGMQRRDFLASSDRAFRPVNMAVGPDGALYVLDMNRAVIEHPEWIPDDIEKNLDVNAGKDKGRIYRITPRGGLPRLKPAFDRKDIAGVAAKLAHRNKWQRDTAQRLLVEWQAQAAIAPLENLFATSDFAPARLHAMWTLHGLKALQNSILLQALRDAHAGVRENALILAEEGLAAKPDILEAALKLAQDADARVRMQTALTLSTLERAPDEKTQEALLAIAKQDAHDLWTRLALICGAKQAPFALLQKLLAEKEWQASAGAKELLAGLTQQIGLRRQPLEIAATLEGLSTLVSDEILSAALDGLAAGLENSAEKKITAVALGAFAQRESISVVRASWRVQKALGLKIGDSQAALLQKANAVALNSAEPTARRLEHLALLEFAEFSQREATLYELLDPKHPRDVQMAAIKQLGRVAESSVGKKLLSMWKSLSPDVRTHAGDILLYRARNHALLLTALEKKEVTPGELNFHLERLRTLLYWSDKKIQQRAQKLFTDAGVVTRQEALEKMRPALALQGDPEQGREVYHELCAKCHRLGEEGEDLGPNLTEIFRKSAESLLQEIVDPNAAVESKFLSHVVRTTDGEFITGIIINETDADVTICGAGGERKTVRRDQIAELSATGQSLMPEQLEDGMTPQTLANLLAFLMQPR